jgi:epoxide hydrolase-like predicted phosphatase
MIKAVIFDAGGVLHFSKHSQSEDLKQELGLSDEQISKFYSHYVPLLGKGLMTEAEMWDELQETCGIRSVSEDENLMTRAWEKSLEKMPGMYELIYELKQKGIIIILLTNVTPQFAKILEEQGHYEPFDFKVLSYEVGMWKPESKMYERALELASIKPNEAVFVDDLQKNVEAANKLGMHGIVFKDAEDLRSRLLKLIN